jgi:hypothetical protein
MDQHTPPGTSHGTHGPVSPFARARQKRQADEMVDRYVAWREAAAAVGVAYDRWKGAGRVDEEVTCSIYLTLLDHEEQAAFDYQAAVAQLAAAQLR